MADRRPLVLVGGLPAEIPAGDTVSSTIAPGTGGAGADLALNNHILAASFTVTAARAGYIPRYLEIGATFALEIGAAADMEIG